MNALYFVQLPEEESPGEQVEEPDRPIMEMAECGAFEYETFECGLYNGNGLLEGKKSLLWKEKGKSVIKELYPVIELGDGSNACKKGESSNGGNLPGGYDFDLDPRMPLPVKKIGPAEDTVSIEVDTSFPDRALKIGSQLSPEMFERLSSFLKANLDVFAWSHADMVGIDPNIMCHHLNVDPAKKGVRQK